VEASSGAGRDRQLAVWIPTFAAALLAAAYEVGARQTDAYLGPSLSTPRGLALALSAFGLGLGFLAGRRLLQGTAARGRLLVRFASVASVVCSASPALWFWGFSAPRALPFVACVLPSLVGLAVGACSGALFQATALAYRELQGVRLLLAPVPLLLALGIGLAGSTALSYLGLWRAAATVAGVLVALALLVPRFADYLADAQRPTRWPGVAALGVSVVSFAAAQAFVPAQLLARYPSEVVWADADAELVVISAQNTFELFESTQLVLSSADDYRYAELAVHPLLSVLRPRRRVLVLGPAGGSLEREVLRYRNVAEVVSLSETDRRAFRASLWPRHTATTALNDPRLRFVVAEPLPWLGGTAQLFDAIVVSQPAPATASEGKYYTRYFYGLLAEHLTERGALVVQATSRSALPGTFAVIRDTLQGAGLSTTSYEAPIPLLGAVSFVIATRHDALQLDAPALPPGLRFVDSSALRRAFSPSPSEPTRSAISTLDELHAMEVWHHEQLSLGN
jgi:predicted membrane-bound spermidine synthase